LLLIQASPAVFAQKDNTQDAQLHDLQAAFHRAASVRDWVHGDSPEVVDDRIRDMLKLWANGGVLNVAINLPQFDQINGIYRGNSFDDCPMPVVGPFYEGIERGTLCSFFRYKAGSFAINPATGMSSSIVSLAPSYKTRFEISGRTARVYFECHYFNVSPASDPAPSGWPPLAGLPRWTSTLSHIAAPGWAVKVRGEWRFSYLDALLAADAALDPPMQ
jgi:hypothetical protein